MEVHRQCLENITNIPQESEKLPEEKLAAEHGISVKEAIAIYLATKSHARTRGKMPAREFTSTRAAIMKRNFANRHIPRRITFAEMREMETARGRRKKVSSIIYQFWLSIQLLTESSSVSRGNAWIR